MPETSASRPASTILLLRDGAQADGKGRGEMEIFMMVRHHQIEFNSGALVFPGGSVDAGDQEIVARADLYSGGEGLSEADRGFRIAAIRETFEESGILLARSKGSNSPIDAMRAGEIADAHRVALNEHKISFLSILADNDLQLALDTLVPYAHWITPEGMPKRFDTWFFLAPAPPGAAPRADGSEVIDARWYSPMGALEAGRRGEIFLVFPTIRQLEQLSGFASAHALLEHARGREVQPIEPRVVMEGETARIVLPGDPGYTS